MCASWGMSSWQCQRQKGTCGNIQGFLRCRLGTPHTLSFLLYSIGQSNLCFTLKFGVGEIYSALSVVETEKSSGRECGSWEEWSIWGNNAVPPQLNSDFEFPEFKCIDIWVFFYVLCPIFCGISFPWPSEQVGEGACGRLCSREMACWKRRLWANTARPPPAFTEAPLCKWAKSMPWNYFQSFFDLNWSPQLFRELVASDVGHRERYWKRKP